MTEEEIARKFWANVEKAAPHDCWNWVGYMSNKWGVFRVQRGGFKLQQNAPRQSWTMHFGPPPAGHIVKQKCGNKACVNPSHLVCETKACSWKAATRRFWANIVKGENEDECWGWVGYISGEYPGICYPNGNKGHRLSYELHHGPIPPGLVVCHHCDNPRCCNPKHLFLGTVADNNYDRDKKGRTKYDVGEDHYAHILTDTEVLQLRREYKSKPYCISERARGLGITDSALRNAIFGKKWKHLNGVESPAPHANLTRWDFLKAA